MTQAHSFNLKDATGGSWAAVPTIPAPASLASLLCCLTQNGPGAGPCLDTSQAQNTCALVVAPAILVKVTQAKAKVPA